MKNKILGIFFALVVAIPMLTSVFAVSAKDILAKLDGIVDDIDSMKKEYEQILQDYPDVIDSLSEESKDKALNLADKLMADGNANALEQIKTELSNSSVPNADKVLEAVQGLESKAEALIDDNKDIIEEVKSGYTNLTTSEIKQVIEKVTDIVESLGVTVDVTDTYNEVMSILDDAHDMAKEINAKLEDVIANNVDAFESALTMDLAKELLNEVKAKDKEAIIDTLIEAINNVEGSASLKADLKEIKTAVIALKDKLMELANLEEQDLLMFTDVQKEAISEKVKAVIKDYVDFAKIILDSYSEDYMDVVIGKMYNKSVDQMIGYANTALDYLDKYKDTITSLTAQDVIDMLGLPKDLVKKAGIMVALGFVDTSNLNKESIKTYVKNTFGTQISNLKDYMVNELAEYINYIFTSMENEINDTFNAEGLASVVQNNLRTITTSRFNTLANIKSLKDRVDKELLSNFQSVKTELDALAKVVYKEYEGNILSSIGATMMKENEDAEKQYECLEDSGIILSNRFFTTSDFTQELGIPSEHSAVASYSNIASGKIKTGTTLELDISDSVHGEVSFVVLGDIYDDGIIDARDYMMIKNYIMDNDEMSEEALVAADTYRDESIDARDYMVIKNYIMDGTEISL